MVRSDNEINRLKIKEWFAKKGIDFERCALDTHKQNRVSKRMGRLIIAKSQAIRLSGKLPHDL